MASVFVPRSLLGPLAEIAAFPVTVIRLEKHADRN